VTTLDGTYDTDAIDAVQLGTGGNTNPLSLQVYGFPLMNPDGTIPAERLTLAASGRSGASASTNYAAWVASTDWRELPVYTSGAACLPLFAPVLLSGSPWGVLFGTSNVQQRVRMTATAPGSALAATQAVIRATWWANSTADALAVWTGWNQAQTNTLTAAATGTVQTAVWTNAAGSGSIYADVPVTGNGTSGYTAFPRLEVIWR
jgi:hypothetical protein